MGSDGQKAPFGPLIRLVSHLVTASKTETTSDEEYQQVRELLADQSDSKKDRAWAAPAASVPREALALLANEHLVIETVAKGNLEVRRYAKALAHACWGNRRLSKRVLRAVLKALNAAEHQSWNQSFLVIVKSLLALDDKDAETGEPLLAQRFEWVFGYPSLPVAEGDDSKLGLEASRDPTVYRSSLTPDPKIQPLTVLLYDKQTTYPDTTLKMLDLLVDVFTSSPAAMDFIARLPATAYEQGRWTDWLRPFLTRELNRRSAGSMLGGDSVVSLINRLGPYDEYVRALEAEEAAAGNDRVRGQLSCALPAYVVLGRLGDGDDIRMLDDGGQLSMVVTPVRASYLVSKPLGAANQAIV